MQRKPTVPEERWTELRRSRLRTGDELVLHSRGSRYELRFNGRELMSDRAHWSESALGALACDAIQSPKPRILIGGLGLGYTLRAALDALPASAGVIVAE